MSDPHTAVGLAAARIIAETKSVPFILVTFPISFLRNLLALFFPSTSPLNIHQIILSTAHPAKFSEAVSRALEQLSTFNFDRDVLPKEFEGLLQREKRVIEVERPDIELVKAVIEQVARKK